MKIYNLLFLFLQNLSTQGSRRKHRQSNQRGEFLRKAVEYLENEATSSHQGNKKDEADVYAEGWAISFRKLSEDQKLYAKRIIEEALLLGQLTKLSLASQITNPVCSSFSSSSASTTASSASSVSNRFDLLEPRRTSTPVQILRSQENIQIDAANDEGIIFVRPETPAQVIYSDLSELLTFH